jgi:protein-disulfide isomerase
MTKFGIHAKFSALGLLAVLACQQEVNPTQPVVAQPEDAAPAQVAARINGSDITIDELDVYIKEELFARATSNGDAAKLYEVRSQAVMRYLDEQVLEEPAKAANLSTEEYLSQQIDAAGGVTEEEIAAYYEENKNRMGGASLEDIKDRIETYLRALRGNTLVAELREKAGTAVLLEPARIEVEAVGPARGPDDAAVTIIEFSDFQCPYCQRAVPTIEQILEKYPTQVRVVFRHLPLDTIHDRAQPAAEAAVCAGNQEKFWDYHDVLFANNRALSDEDLERYAVELGLEMEAFKRCVSERESQPVVDIDTAAAKALGLSGTPAFFVNGIPMTGAQPLEKFSAIIDEELARPTAESSAPTS